MKKLAFFLLTVTLIASFWGPQSSARAGSAAPSMRLLAPAQNKIDASLKTKLNSLKAGDMITVIVTLRQQADLSQVTGLNRKERQKDAIRKLQGIANITQGKLKTILNARHKKGLLKNFESLWVINGFSVTATSVVINELAQHPDVYSISPDDIQIVPAFAAPEANITLVNAPSLWNQGYTGQGVVVANMDTGVDNTHPDLSARYRGGTNSWFDPYGQHATPFDNSGHGTQTMGIMVGGDAGGTSVGVAPGAQWIAVKIFNDAGSSTATAIHQGFQWLLDPDGNPNTADAPDVVNNSWTFSTPGCNTSFEADLLSLRAADILPVFAAGNGGPSANTSYSPSNNLSAFAVGAINNSSQIYSLSSRGPTTCGGSSGPFPELVAPGVTINTTDLFHLYTNAYSGTSYAAPHVAGGLALLLSAYPNLSVTDQQNALINSAVDLGASGPDDVYGYGRLDILAAFNWLAVNPTSTPGPSPTYTATSSPTFTFTPQATNTFTPMPTFTSTPLPTFTFTASPTSTFTPLPTSTFTPSRTITATSTSTTTMHIGDLDRSSVTSGTKWNATVTIKVHNASEGAVANVTVSGKWSNGASGTVTCVTNSSGICTVTKFGLSTSTTSVTYTVTNVTATSLTYKSTLNHDPDGDSTGTVIVVLKP